MKLTCSGLLKSFFIVALLLTSANIAALGQPGNGKPCPKLPCPKPFVPITGIELLIAAGGALGLKKVLSRKNKTTE
jgi:hypothetical protein